MNDLWASVLYGTLLGFFAGILAGILANKLWELWTRSRVHRVAEKLAGEWIMYNMHGRNVDPAPEPSTLPTVISPARSRWSADSHVLDVSGGHLSNGQVREHSGFLALDPGCPWRAIRTVRYADSDEISEQRIEIGRDGNTLYVFPTEADYGRHALRRRT